MHGGADHENTTAIITICADGTTLHPTIVRKGWGFKDAWFGTMFWNAHKSWCARILGKHLQLYDSICHSPKGWTDGDVTLSWMIKIFDEQTCDKAHGETCVLILDRHSLHYMPELLEYAQDHDIIIFGYPPHCTHALQGLDVVCLMRMKETWKKVIIEFEALHWAKVTKADFTGLFGKAYQIMFTKETVEVAFCATGVYPFDHQ